MSNTPGTSLIEMLVYLFLSSSILVQMIFLCLHLTTFSLTHVRRQEELVQVACGLSRLAQDLSKLTSLREYRSDKIVGMIKGRNYLWWVKNGRLLRGEGSWEDSGRFSVHAQSLLAASLVSCTYTYTIFKERVVGVTCTLKSYHHSLSLFIALKSLYE